MATSVKNLGKRLIPARYRLLRYDLNEKLRYYPELISSLGSRLECPFCGWKFRRFRPAGFDYPVLKEKHVVGASLHPDDVCPRCYSNARERLIYLYLKKYSSLFNERLSVLHVAPERNLSRELRFNTNLRYVTADLFEPNVMARVDLMSLPFADQMFDWVICNHVLEHVTNDRLAMSELLRALKPGGRAILQVPIALAISETIEDDTARTDEDRIRLFGQRDHVRLYSERDYVSRLKQCGFDVEVVKPNAVLGQEALMRYALIPEEDIFVCKK